MHGTGMEWAGVVSLGRGVLLCAFSVIVSKSTVCWTAALAYLASQIGALIGWRYGPSLSSWRHRRSLANPASDRNEGVDNYDREKRAKALNQSRFGSPFADLGLQAFGRQG
jgi:membrane protein YqaA with SNARE-associated domain